MDSPYVTNNPYARTIETIDRTGMLSGSGIVEVAAWRDMIDGVLAAVAPGASVLSHSTSSDDDGSVNFQLQNFSQKCLTAILGNVPVRLPGGCTVKVGDAGGGDEGGRQRVARPPSSGVKLYVKVTPQAQANLERRRRFASKVRSMDFVCFVLAVICLIVVVFLWKEHNDPYSRPFEILADAASRTLDAKRTAVQGQAEPVSGN